ncbi:PulJ/GspJ family protein [Microbacterium rhizophilus]|uniref:PulJ/GspJ family protein n=1 Tax=Microbacterium rhizophilus TaxID=3138934 RepID=UPI0031EB5875
MSPPDAVPALGDDSGFTLVELLIYIVLLGFILAAGFGLLSNSFRGSNLVMESADASREGQTIARTINSSVRNASHVTVSTDGRFFVAATVAGQCHGWYAASSGDVFVRLSTSKIGRPTVAEPAGWIHIGSGVTPAAGDARIFIQSDDGVAVRFTVATANQPTLIDTLSTPRTPATGVNPCVV